MADNITSDPPSSSPKLQNDEFVIAHGFDADGTLLPARLPAAETAWVWKSYALADARARRSISKQTKACRKWSGRHFSPPVTNTRSAMKMGGFSANCPIYSTSIMVIRVNLVISDLPSTTGFSSAGGAIRSSPSTTCGKSIGRGKIKPASPIALFNAIFRRFLELLKAEIAKLLKRSIQSRITSSAKTGRASANGSCRSGVRSLSFTAISRRRQVCSATSTMRIAAPFPKDLDDLIEGLSRRAATLHAEGEQLQQRARLLQDELLAKLTDQSNQFLYVLSVMTAVLLPSTVISGLFGMNTGGLPLAEQRTRILARRRLWHWRFRQWSISLVRKIGGSRN